MDSRRGSLAVPKVRRVGFFTSDEPPPPPESQRPSRTQSGPPESTSSPPISEPASGDSLSPVMIPPARHHSENLASRAAPLPVPGPAVFRRHLAGEPGLHVGSYNPADSLLGTSPLSSSNGAGEFSEDSVSLFGFQRSDSASLTPATRPPPVSEAKTTVPAASEAKKNVGVSGKCETVTGVVESQKELQPSSSKPLKAKTTKAERRALQEAQRAAKAVAKEGNRAADVSAGAIPGKAAKQPSQKKDRHTITSSTATTEKKAIDRAVEKDRKKDVPPTRMQFDDKSRVEKAKRRAVVGQTESKSRVELFRHLPQYERSTQLQNLNSKIFTLDTIHPAVYKVGLQYLAGDISGGNARCTAMLQAFQEAIKDYSTPPKKILTMDLTAKINSYVSFLIECRPLSISMGNAIRFLKSQVSRLPVNLSESEAKASLCSDIGRYINEKIILADKVIVQHAVTKIREGDVLLTYGFSCVIEMILLYAHETGKRFRVVIVDSHPNHEGKKLLRNLVTKGLSCTYTHINAVSYIMGEVTRVFLGASSVFSNGTLYSRVGTASVAMVAHAFSVPVIVCCEAYKFQERVLLDSICSNELGDPDAILNVGGRPDVNYLKDRNNKEEKLQLLNLMYDATPSEYIWMIITDYGMIPTTSVPVIVREYRRDHLLL